MSKETKLMEDKVLDRRSTLKALFGPRSCCSWRNGYSGTGRCRSCSGYADARRKGCGSRP